MASNRISNCVKANVIDAYREYRYTQTYIAQVFNISRSSVRRILIEAGELQETKKETGFMDSIYKLMPDSLRKPISGFFNKVFNA